MIFDDYYDFYKDKVDLCELQLNTSPIPNEQCNGTKDRQKFSFDTTVIMYLWSIGHKCRDPLLRRRAVNLLLDNPPREGLWDSVFAGKSSPLPSLSANFKIS